MDTLIEDALYAVKRADGWYLARWDGGAFNVESWEQSGDRWFPEWIEKSIHLPE